MQALGQSGGRRSLKASDEAAGFNGGEWGPLRMSL